MGHGRTCSPFSVAVVVPDRPLILSKMFFLSVRVVSSCSDPLLPPADVRRSNSISTDPAFGCPIVTRQSRQSTGAPAQCRPAHYLLARRSFIPTFSSKEEGSRGKKEEKRGRNLPCSSFNLKTRVDLDH
jgi:hypothetical protein